MKRIQFSHVLILSSFLCIPVSFADSDRPLFSVSVSESGVPQNNNEGGITRSSATESRVLPIWGDEARARGYGFAGAIWCKLWLYEYAPRYCSRQNWVYFS